jgi:hypothetical protein
MGGGGAVSCAACSGARGFSTPCPYCRAPGDLQVKAAREKAAELSVQERIAVALERIAAALEKKGAP